MVKPNWVLHENGSGAGLDCLITHTSVLDAVLYYLGRASPAHVVLGDAPVQRCDFGSLRREAGIDALVAHHQHQGLPVHLVDFRGRVAVDDGAHRNLVERPERKGLTVTFDLGPQSFLEPITDGAPSFRVTRYAPGHMARAHRPGVHRYAIAREVLDADVVISVPKLKSHFKAGMTGALKNLVGINVDKSYLPHHRKGGSAVGGDGYAGFSLFRHLCEELYDLSNSLERYPVLAHAVELPIRLHKRLGSLLGQDTRVDGAWYGNDTVWRMCLDLQRILRYGRVDGTLADGPQRKVFSVVDAIVGGEGDGPLSPTPVRSGFMTAGCNPVSVEWINARLMGFDPARIPLLREAMQDIGEHGLVDGFDERTLQVLGLTVPTPATELHPLVGRCFRPARGWQGHVELLA